MKIRWQSHDRRRPGGPPQTLAIVEPQRPLARLRPETDGTPQQGAGRRSRWLQPLPLAAAALILLAFAGYLSVYRQTTKRTGVLVATHALPAGAVLQASDLAHARLAGDKRVLATLVPASDEGVVLGQTLRAPVAAGAPLPAAALTARGHAATALTLAVPALHALAGDLRPGDRITVLATYTGASGGSLTRVVARNLDVLAVGAASGFDPASQTIPVTVALTDTSQASALALANETGKLDLLREPGAGSAAPIPPATSPAAGAP